MPYITQSQRDRLTGDDPYPPEDVGELNFVITSLCVGYLHKAGLCYATINDIMGVLSSAQAEFYRRAAAPYEQKKMETNGDVYPNDKKGK